MLTDLIARYMDAKNVWEAEFDQDCESASGTPEWRRYMSLTDEILTYRCTSREEHIKKIELIESDGNLLDELGRCSDERKARLFLASFIGGAFYGYAPVDNGEN